MIDGLVRTLADDRKALAEKVKKWQDLHAVFLLQNAVLSTEIDTLETKVNEDMRAVRDAALVEYGESGEKHQAFGVTIRVFDKIEYDGLTAFEWAKEHQLALALDAQAFEKFVRADPSSFDFAKVVERPQAQIPSNLSAAETHEGVVL